jgi:hypothetical protein
MEGGDAKVDAVKAVVDIEEMCQCNRERRSRNRRVNVEIDVIKPPEPKHMPGLPVLSMPSGQKYTPVLQIPNVQGREPQPWSSI